MPSIPADIIENIVDRLAEEEGFHSDSVNSQSTLLACTMVSRAFYWPAMKYVFREVHLHTQGPEFRGISIVLNPQSPDEGPTMNDYSSAHLREFLDLTKKNPWLLRVIRSVHVYIASDYLQDGRPEELWNIFELLIEAKEVMRLNKVTISSPRQMVWSWLEGISDLYAEVLLLFLQLVRGELRFNGVRIQPYRIGPFLTMFNSVQRISFANIRGRKFIPDASRYLDMPAASVVNSENTEYHAVESSRTVAIDIRGIEDILFLDGVLQSSYMFLVVLELKFVNLHPFTAYGLRCDLAYLTALQEIHIKLFIRYYGQTNERASGYGPISSFSEPEFSSKTIVDEFVPTHPSPVLHRPTHIKTIGIDLTLIYDAPDFIEFYKELQSAYPTTESNSPQPALDLDEWEWSDFHPSSFRNKNPNLQKLKINITFGVYKEDQNDTGVVALGEFEYGANKNDVEVLLEGLIRSKILWGSCNARDSEVLNVSVKLH